MTAIGLLLWVNDPAESNYVYSLRLFMGLFWLWPVIVLVLLMALVVHILESVLGVSGVSATAANAMASPVGAVFSVASAYGLWALVWWWGDRRLRRGWPIPHVEIVILWLLGFLATGVIALLFVAVTHAKL